VEDAMSDAHPLWPDEVAQDAEAWLETVRLGCRLANGHQAARALRAVLHAIRDRLPVADVAHLGSRLPHPILGIYYDGWAPNSMPAGQDGLDGFLAEVAAELPPQFPCTPLCATDMVCGLLWTELGAAVMVRVVHALPVPVRCLGAAPASC
jgi:uncharacterized protein (DUF2267 family)